MRSSGWQDPPVVSPMWTCPACGRPFANRNQTHACGPLGDLNRLFEGCAPQVRACFDAVLEAARRAGPLTVLPERTRVAFQVRMSFAAFQPRRRWLDGHVVLARELPSPRFRRIEVFSPRTGLPAFRLHAPQQLAAK